MPKNETFQDNGIKKLRLGVNFHRRLCKNDQMRNLLCSDGSSLKLWKKKREEVF